MNILKIQTERCLIRPFTESDIDEFMMYRNDMPWMKYQSFKGLDKQAYMDALLSDMSLREGLQSAVISKETGSLIGDIYIKQEDSFYWIGYTINPSMARHGYAFEAVSAVINMLKTELNASCIKAGVNNENTASIALLEKLNFQYAESYDDERIYVLRFEALEAAKR